MLPTFIENRPVESLNSMVRLFFFQIRAKWEDIARKLRAWAAPIFLIPEMHYNPVIYNGYAQSRWQTDTRVDSGLRCREKFQKFITWLKLEQKTVVFPVSCRGFE